MALHDPADPPISRRALGVVLVLVFSQDALFGLLFLSYMNHYLLDVLRTSPGLPGYTLALYGGTKLVVHPLAGRLLDKTSPRNVFRATVAVQVTALGLILGFHHLWAFLLATILFAAGSAGSWPLIYDAVARTQAPAVRSRVAGIMALVGYIATGAGFALGVLLPRFAPWRPSFLGVAVLVLLPALLERSSILRRGSPAADEEEAPVSSADRRRMIGLFAAIIFLDYSAISSLAGIYGPYARRELHISLFHTSLLLAPAGLAAVASLALAARLSRPSRRFLEMTLLYCLSGPAALGLASTTTPGIAAAVAIPLALGLGGTGPIVAATMLDLGGERSRGFLIGSLMSIEGVGAVVGPAATATITNLFNPRAGLGFIGFLLLLLAPLTFAAWAVLRGERVPAPVPSG